MAEFSPFHSWSAASPYALALGLAALLCTILAIVGWRRRSRPGGVPFILMMAAAATWALFYSFELTTPSLAGKVFWAKTEYVGICLLPLCWLLFARSYTGATKRLTYRALALISFIPALTVVLAATNGFHHLLWSQLSLGTSGSFPNLVVVHGPWFWVHLTYAYGLLAGGSLVLVRTALRYPELYRKQAGMLMLATVAPWVGNGLSIFRALPGGGVDVTPFAFTLTGVALLLATSRFRLLSLLPALLPAARSQLLQKMKDGVLVLDLDGRVVNCNPAAARMVARPAGEVMGKPAAEILGEVIPGFPETNEGSDAQFEIRLGGTNPRRYLDVVSSNLALRGGAGMGRLLVLRDITERRRAEEALRENEERFRALIENSSDLIAVLDDKGTVRFQSPSSVRILGYLPEELEGQAVFDHLHPDDRAESQQAFARLLGGEWHSSTQIEARFRHKDGSWRVLEVMGKRLIEPTGGFSCVLNSRDITERKAAEQAALESERRYRTLVDNAHDLILTLDSEGRFTSVNPAVERVTGYGASELLGRFAGELTGDLEAPGAFTSPLLDPAERRELRLVSKGGSEIVFEASVRAVYDGGELSGYECIARDVTESRKWEDALRFQALHDSVTSLPNRMHLRERLDTLVRSSRTAEERFALYVLDLDRFKDINDSLGHHSGDLLLQVAAARLAQEVRGTDLLTRLGGDEFALIAPVDDVEDARRIALRILEVFKHPFRVDGRELALSASIGIALFPTHGSGVDNLLRFADIAMYAAKRAGGARYAIYELDGAQHSPDRLTLQAELHAAFGRGEFTLYYQPQVDLGRGGISAVEALVRWNHPRRGLILPSQFLDLLEEDGLADRLTKWALRKALGQCARWRARGLSPRVSVNLSARNLDDPDLPRLIGGLLSEQRACPDWLTLELTEGSIMIDPERSLRALAAIKELGSRIAIDDFGRGQSALTYLKKLPADEVKIDKSFVIAMTIDKQDATIVRSTIGLGHELGLSVVAEGVENEATLRLLRAYGCDYGQGYYLGRPVRPSSVFARSRRRDGSVRPSLTVKEPLLSRFA